MKNIFCGSNSNSSVKFPFSDETKRKRTTKKKEVEVPAAVSAPVDQAMQIDLSQLLGPVDDDPRLIFFTGEVSEESIMGVIAQLTILASKSPTEPIILVISTYGGSVHEMFGLYDMIKWLPCPVHTVGLGKIMSAGVLLLASGEKGHRMIGEHSRVMLHPMMAGHYGNVFELRNEMKELESMQDTMEQCLARETGRALKEVKDMMETGKDSYLTAQQAVDLGLADSLISHRTKVKFPE